MDTIDQLFGRMDAWRHLPSYQLERRADLVFSLYLLKVLGTHTGSELSDQLVPEFPVRIGTVNSHVPIDKSYKIDYVTFSRDGKQAYLVELKTEQNSIRQSQIDYLDAAKSVGMAALLAGIVRIFQATNAQHKYLFLLRVLESLGQVRLPAALSAADASTPGHELTAAAGGIVVTTQVESIQVIYVQPNGERQDVVNFDQFASAIEGAGDPFADRFAKSLREWARVPAGRRALI